MPRTRYDDDYELINGKWVLKDGHRAKFSFMDGDDLQRAVGQYFADRTAVSDGQKIVDGFGQSGLALLKPGFRTTANAEARDTSFYDAYDRDVSARYLDANHTAGVEGVGSRGFVGKSVGDTCTCASKRDRGRVGDRGHVERDDDTGELICVSDNHRNDDALDTRDHATKMRDIYSEVDREMSEAWKNPTR